MSWWAQIKRGLGRYATSSRLRKESPHKEHLREEHLGNKPPATDAPAKDLNPDEAARPGRDAPRLEDPDVVNGLTDATPDRRARNIPETGADQ